MYVHGRESVIDKKYEQAHPYINIPLFLTMDLFCCSKCLALIFFRPDEFCDYVLRCPQATLKFDSRAGSI
jgi:hypothetical protein